MATMAALDRWLHYTVTSIEQPLEEPEVAQVGLDDDIQSNARDI